MFLRRRVRPEIFTKLLAAFIIVYAAVLLVGIGYRTAIWDEFQNTALPFLLYDMTTNAGSIGPGFAALKAYAIDYQAHYAVFYSLIHHPPFHRIFLYAAFMLAGPGEVSGRAVSVAFAVLALVVTYMAAYRMTKRRDLSLLSCDACAHPDVLGVQPPDNARNSACSDDNPDRLCVPEV